MQRPMVSFVAQLLGGKFDDEPGPIAAVGARFNPNLARVESNMLRNEGEPEPRTIVNSAPSCSASSCKALEDEIAFIDRHSLSGVLDDDLDTVGWTEFIAWDRDAHASISATMNSSIVNEVCNGARQPTAVAGDQHSFRPRRRCHDEVGKAADSDGLSHELADEEFIKVQANCPSIKS